MKRDYFWLIYDLGIDGDYDALYAWLDAHDARECGDSACYFRFDSGHSDPRKAILSSLRQSVRLRPRDRLYLIYPKPDGRPAGRFLHGSRRRSPWAGFALESRGNSEDAGD